MGDENNPNNEANKPIDGAGDNGSAANGEQNGTMNGNDGASSSVGGGGGGGAGSDSPTTATSSGAVSSVIAAAGGGNGAGVCGSGNGEIQVITDQNGHNNDGDNNAVPDGVVDQVENGVLNGGGEPSGNDAGNGDSGVEEGNDGGNNGGGGGDCDDDNIAGTVGGGGADTTEADGDIGGGPPTDTGLLSEGGLSSIIGVGPPSPLTGCYLLIVLGEPHSDEHKDIILQRLIKGLLSWDVSDCHVDLEEELNTITQHAPEGEEARYGERLIQYASENLVTEILIHPQYNTLIQCMRNLLSSFTRHRHIIHSGYTFSGNGSWILQDGTFSVSDFSEAFQEHEVQRVIRAYPDTISTNIHCSDAGLWLTLPDKSYAKLCKIRINPNDVLNTSEKINEFIDYLAPMLVPATIHDLLETSDVVGNIRFSHPTLYVFPGGQGDAALFGINGFNMLVDGGFNRKACFWDFARHLDRLDAVLLTRINNSNISGLSSVVERKKDDHVYPQIGHFFCNIPERKSLPSPDGDKDKDPLLIELIERGHNLVSNLKVLNLKPQHCYRDTEPINLYHKVGHGTLDMYVISPSKDSKEVKEFLQKWHASDNRLFATKDTKEFNFPLQNLVSICAMLVWQPANPEDTITRILFPGSTPDFKILEGLDRIKHLEFMKHPTCTAKTIAPALPAAIPIIKKSIKASQFEKTEPTLPSKVVKPMPSTDKQDNKIIDNKSKIIQQQDNKIQESESEIIPTKKESKLIEDELKEDLVKDEPIEHNKDNDIMNTDNEIDNKVITEKKVEVVIVKPQMHDESKKEDIDIKSKSKQKPEKPRAEVKPVVRSRIDTKPPKSMERKSLKKDLMSDKKSSPTATPQKKERPIKDKEIKSKVISRISKSSPSSTPAKSAKDANNRKVLESKQKSSKVIKREITKTVTEKKEIKTERKPISRRPRGTSPSKHVPGSPVKSIKPKSDLRKSRLEKGGTTTDSSLVSTPSADEIPAVKKIPEIENDLDIDPIKQRELDDLKEEQEVVREIEAVFNRDEQKRQKDLKSDHREVGKQDSTTEAEEEEEYLIIEKEEIEQYTEDSINDQESSMTKEEEIQKHQRDSQESEKKRKTSAEEEIEVAIAKAEAAEAEAKARAKKTKEIDIKEKDADEQVLNKRKEHDEDDVDDDIQPDSIEEKIDLTSPEKGEIKAEVQDILVSAKEIVKAKTEEIKTEDMSSPTPEEKISSAKKTSDTKDELLDVPDVNKETNLQESLPEEKFSATIESGATTAPTLPEDERIPLDEIKEDLVIEEKYVKEETKEAEIPESPPKTIEPIQQFERTLPAKMQFQTQSNLLRDIVKTPDEVADLPVHEEADIGYDEVTSDGKRKSFAKEDSKPLKEEIAKEEKEIEEMENIQQEKLDEKKTLESKEIKIVTTTKSEVLKDETIEIYSEDKLVSPKGDIPTDIDALKEKDQSPLEIDHGLLGKDSIKTELTEIADAKNSVQTTKNIEKISVSTHLVQTQAIEDTSEEKKHISEIPAKGSSEPSAPTSEDEVPETLKSINKLIESKDRNDTISVESPGTIEEIISVDISKSKVIKDNIHEEDHIIEKNKTEVGVILKTGSAQDQEPANIAFEQVVSTPVHTAEEKDFIIASEISEICEARPIESEEKVTTKKPTTEIATTVKENIINNITDLSKNIIDLKNEFSTDVEALTADIKQTSFKKIEETASKMEHSEISEKIDHKMEKAETYLEDGFIGLKETVNDHIDEIKNKIENITGNKREDDILSDIKHTSECIEDSPKIVGVIAKETERVNEVSQLSKNIVQVGADIKEITKSESQDMKKIVQNSIKNDILNENKQDISVTDYTVVDIPTKTETNITSVLGGIAQEIASVLGKEKVEPDVTELKTEPTDSESTEKKSSFEITSFRTELRETHITTIDSPVIEEPGHVEDYKILAYEREDSGLNDIKEEEEENRYSPPRKASTEKLIKIESQPPRPVSPREKEVAIIVANVAEVLKSDKPITEIIPDFDEKQLEEKLLKTAKEVESTVQRMLVTASSEDGGEEIEICPHGSIKFTPASTPEILSGKATPDVIREIESDFKDDKSKLTSKEYDLEQLSKTSDICEEIKTSTKSQPASEKSSPEHKSATFSIEEKDKIEISEKEQNKDVQSKVEQEKPERKDSVSSTVEQTHIDRRQSIISMSSEKDITKDESTFDERADSSSSAELGKMSPESGKISPVTKYAETRASKESIVSSHTTNEIKNNVEKTESFIIETRSLEKKSDQKTPSPLKEHRPQSVVSQSDDKSKTHEISDTISIDKKTDGKIQSPSKEHSRPESVASHADEKDIARKESIASSHSKDTKEDEQRKESLFEEILSPENKLDEKSPSLSKEASRPESVASHVDEKEVSRKESIASSHESKETEEVAERKESIISETLSLGKKSDNKTPSPSKEHSRPESVASHADEKDIARKESIASTHSKDTTEGEERKESLIDKTSEKSPSVSKEPSRPESVASHIDENEITRKESVASSHESKEMTEDVTRKESIISETLSVAKKSDDKTPSPSKEHSRPESVASHVDEKDTARKESIASIHIKDTTEGEERKESLIDKTSEKSPSVSKEPSRPESVASHIDENEITRKESIASSHESKEMTEDVTRKESIISETLSVGKKSDDKTPSPSKEHSRPESVASHIDEKEISRKESIASSHESKETEEVAERKESVISETVSLGKKLDDKTPSPLKEHSRPESVASHADEKDIARKESIASTHSKDTTEGEEGKESLIDKTSEKSPSVSKEPSRPESVASHIDENEITRKESVASSHESKEMTEDVTRKESIISETLSVGKKSDDKTPSPSKEHSRPESVASHVDEKEISRKESIASSHESKETEEVAERKESVISETVSLGKKLDDKTPSPSIEHSRPESVASHVDEKDTARKESIASIHIKDTTEGEERKESLIDKTSEKSPSVSKEPSRPESVASHIDENEITRKESVASSHESKEMTEDVTRKESIISETLSVGKKSDDKTPSPSKEHSRPESVASHVDEKEISRKESIASSHESKETEEVAERKESIISETLSLGKKSDDKTPSPSKEHSRPESVASHADEKEVSRKESIASSHESKETEEVAGRKESVISETVSPGKKLDDKTPSPSIEHSRPESVASHVDEKDTARKESIASTHINDTTEGEERKESLIDKTSEKSHSESKEPSRPESVASHIDENEITRKESVASSHESKEMTEDVTRKESIISETLSVGKKSDDKTPSPSKEHSRPQSVASHVDEKEVTRKDSIASSHESKETEEVAERKESVISETLSLGKILDDKTPSPSIEHSRPESVASHVDEKDTARTEPIASIHSNDTTEGEERKESHIDKTSEKSLSVSKEPSRPESVASHIDEKEITRKESVASSHESEGMKEDAKRKESIISETLSVGKILDDKTPSPSKEHSRPESVASLVDEKDMARKESIASIHIKDTTEGDERKESHIDKTSEKSPSVSKEPSRPESVASHIDEKEITRKESAASSHESEGMKEDAKRKESIISETLSVGKILDDKTPSPSKEHSRPESVASLVDEKDMARKESIASIHIKDTTEGDERKESHIDKTSEKSPSVSKEPSRPESVASHIDEKEITRKESVASSHDSKEMKEDAKRKESIISETLYIGKKTDDKTPSPSKEHSRPESVASLVDEKDMARKESIASIHIKDTTEGDERKESHMDKTSEKSPSVSKEPSRPESVASHIDEKEITRKESAASSHESEGMKEDAKRKESIISETLSVGKILDDKTPSPSKEHSRPESVASLVDEKDMARKESIASIHIKDTTEGDERKESHIDKTSEKSPSVSKEPSRPESVASHIDEKEITRKESVASSHDSKEMKEDAKRKESIISETLSVGKILDDKTPSPSKEHSRPASVASLVDEKDMARKESIASIHIKDTTEGDERKESHIDKTSEKFPSVSKEPSRTESVASHIDEKEITRKESVASSHDSKEMKEDAKRKESIISETLSVGKISDDKTPSPSKEHSRPESVASLVDEKDMARKESIASIHIKDTTEGDERKESHIDKTSEKSPSVSKEPSRPESVASHIDEKEITRKESVASSHESEGMKEDAKRKESIISETLSVGKILDDKTPSPSKEHSRPESVASLVDEKDMARKESIASIHIKDTTEGDERKESHIDKTSEKSPSVSKEPSRPESVASHIDEKEITRKESVASSHDSKEMKEDAKRKESIISETLSVGKISDDKTPSPSKEHSRPESVASLVDEKDMARKESIASIHIKDTTEGDERKESHIDKTSEKSPSVSKEPSRPESVASHIDEKEITRKESVASSHESEGMKEDAKRKESIISETLSVGKILDDKTPSPSKEHSRPESVASLVDEKDMARKESIASIHIKDTTEGDERKESHIVKTSEKSPSVSKEPSRPESVASHIDEKEITRKESVASSHESEEMKEDAKRKESIISETLSVGKILDDKTPSPSNEHSRPESVASLVDEKDMARKESIASIHIKDTTEGDERKESHIDKTSEKSPSVSKKPSRPESVASHIDEKEITRKESVASSHESEGMKEDAKRKESIISETLSIGKKTDDKTPSPATEPSRPESVASLVDEKDIARKDSVANKGTKEDGERKESLIAETLSSEKKSEEKSPSVSKEPSRPESVASHIDEKDITRKESIASSHEDKEMKEDADRKKSLIDELLSTEKKSDEKSPSLSKESSQPESAASHLDEKEITRKESVASSHDDSKDKKKDEERRESISTETLCIDKKTDDKTPSPSKEHSRPESVASHIDEKEITRKESVASSHESKEMKEDAERKESIISERLSIDKISGDKTPSKEHSRPESVASHIDEKEITWKESVASSHDDSKDKKKDEERRESIITETLCIDKKTDDKTPSPSKKHSRPASVASLVDEKDMARKESIASIHIKDATEGEERKESLRDKTSEKSPSLSKGGSRPESVASHIDEKEITRKEITRTESVASSQESKEMKEDAERKESIISETLSIGKKTEDKTPSPATEHSRPESVASLVYENDIARKDSVAKGTKEDGERRESLIVETLSLEKKSDEKSPSLSKEPSRPESVASHGEEKEIARKESIASSTNSKEIKEDVTRKESIISERLSVGKKPDDKAPSPSKEHSRPDSVASLVHEKDMARVASLVDEKDMARKESIASIHKDTTEGEERKESLIDTTSEKSPSVSKAPSRPESAASHIDEKDITRKESVASSHDSKEMKEDVTGKESIISETLSVGKKSDDKTPSPSKEHSRPESGASLFDEKDLARKESIASIHIKDTTEGEERKESLIDKTSEKSTSLSKEPSRPESVASHIDEKEITRKESVASSHESKEIKEDADHKESIISETLSIHKISGDKTPSKEHSRPESVASHADEKEIAQKESMDIEDKETKKDAERKESVISLTVYADKKSEHKTPSASMEHSRPDSVASHDGEKDINKVEFVSSTQDCKQAKEDVEKYLSLTLSLDKKHEEKSPSPSKKHSRSTPVATHIDENGIIGKQSVASKHEVQESKECTIRTRCPITETLSLNKKSDENPTKCIDSKERREHTEKEKSVISETLSPDKKSITTGLASSEEHSQLINRHASEKKSTETRTTSSSHDYSHSVSSDMYSEENVSSSTEYSVHKSEHSKSNTESALSHSIENKTSSIDCIPSSDLNRLCSTGKKSAAKDSSKITESSSIVSMSNNIHLAESLNNEYLSSSEISSKFGKESQSLASLNIESKQSLAQELICSAIMKTESSYDRSQSDKASIVLKESSADSVRRESTKSQAGEKVFSSQPSSDCEDNEDAELLAMKDSRSKSIASIMMTSIYKPSDEMQHFSSLKEEFCEPPHQLTEEILATKQESTGMTSDGISLISISPESDVCRKFSDDDIKETNELKSETETIVTSYKESSGDLKDDRKTPPTAPVSPNIKAEFGIGSKQTSSQISSKSISRDIISASGTSSPKDLSGKSSPGVTISESRSIPTPADHSSMTGTPDSSPKPTSPFPRVSKDDIKGMSTFSTPDVTRTSSPDVTEIRNLEKSALTASSEKIVTTTVTTITKIISSDGKETVTEEKTITTRDTTDPEEEKVTVTRTRTTSENEKKDDIKLPSTKEIAALKTEYRCSTPGSDDFDPHEVQSPRSDISSGQASRVTEDDEIPPSPLSITSHAAHSPPSKFSYEYDLQHSSSGISKKSDLDIDNSQDDIIPPQYGSEELKSALPVTLSHKIDPMSTSFYGALPDTFGGKSDPIPIQKSITSLTRTYQESLDSSQSGGDSFEQSWTSKKGDHKFLDEADLDFEKALEEHKQVRGEEVMSSVTAKYSYSPSKAAIVDIECSNQQQFPLEDPIVKIKELTSKKQFPVEEVQKTDESTSKDPTKDSQSENIDPAKVWGKPLGLPSPAPISNENDPKTTPKKERKLMASKTKFNNEKNLRKRSESPVKTVKKNSPIYMDLTYVPHNGNSYYSHVEFFKKVRARYYVFSGTEPSREVYNALLEAKQTWEDKDLEVTIIPTYDTDVLGYWVSENEELLSKYHIDLSPSASRCTINLQDHETSCSAYRLEF